MKTAVDLEPSDPPAAADSVSLGEVLRIVLAYAVFASLWILVSDEAVAYIFHEPEAITTAGMIKGWVFIAVTSLLLFVLIMRKDARLHRAHSENMHSLHLLDAIAEGSQDAIFAKDVTGRYLLFNSAACQLAEQPRAEVLGRDDSAIFPEAIAAKIMADDRKVMAEEKVVTYEEELTTRHGAAVFLVTKGPLWDNEGKVIGVFGISRDISVRKLAEVAMLEAKEQAESASRAKSEFLATVSHELRTPLNAILGFSELVMAEKKTNDRQDEWAADIHQAGLHLLELVDDLLDTSAIEFGKLHLRPEIVEIGPLLGNVTHLVQLHAMEKGVALAVDASEAPVRLHVDLRRMKQILLNLLRNAVKFTPEGGVVTLRVAQAADGGVTLCIIDTGIGMDTDGVAKALTLFGQVDSSLSRKYEGSGIGLPLSQRLTEIHGGSLAVESLPDCGTTVTVYLPPSCVAA